MSSFAKRPHRRLPAKPAKEKSYDLPAEDEEEDDGGYITAGFYDDEDEDEYDDPPDAKRKNARKQMLYADDEEDIYGEKKKKPNIFVRFLHAVFPAKGDGAAESVRKIIFDIAVVAFIITGGSVVYNFVKENVEIVVTDKKITSLYSPDLDSSADISKGEKVKIDPVEIAGKVNISEEEIEKIVEEVPYIQPSFLELYSQNPDTVGWISLGSESDPVVNINYPVVKGEDNDYYLTHNFYGDTVQRGAIFADYRNVFEPDRLSANTILYGHNMWNGDTMFAKLSRYYDGGVVKGEAKDQLTFYKNHPTITFNTLYEKAEWKVFACVLFNTQEELGEVYPYLNYRDFDDKDRFNSFILDIMDRSVLWTDVDLTYGDNILTLSTCYYPYEKHNADTRVAVFARKVRDGETADVDVSKAKRNPDPLKFRYQYERDGGSWGGRKWDSSKLLSL